MLKHDPIRVKLGPARIFLGVTTLALAAGPSVALSTAGCSGADAETHTPVDAGTPDDAGTNIPPEPDSGTPPPEEDASTDAATPEPPSVIGYTGSGATTGQIQENSALNMGRSFRVTASGITVRDLGFWDQGANGLAAPHTVTLFSLDNAGANAVATPVHGGSVLVPAGTSTPLDNGFRFASLTTPVTLPIGDYAVVGYGFSTSDPHGIGGNLPPSSTGLQDASFDPFEFTSDASPAYPKGGEPANHTTVSLRYASETPTFLRIMPMGDSITDGVGGTNAGYRAALHGLLAARGIAHQFVGVSTNNSGNLPPDQIHHEGHSGWVIRAESSGRPGLVDQLDNWLGLGGVDPDVILLMIGTNDVNLAYDLDNAPARLDALISRIVSRSGGYKPNARIIVAKIVPITDPTEDARAQTYNLGIETVVAQHAANGDKVTLVDMHSALTLADMNDKLHPNDAGYEKMANVWMDALVSP